MGKFIPDEVIINNYKEKYPDIIIKNVPHKRGEKTGECYCTICKSTIFKSRDQMLDCSGCPICLGYEVKTGYNDICTTDPWMVPYFVDPEYPKIHKANSGKKTKVKCPICGYIKPQETTPNRLYHQKFSCPMCSDNITFPNKMAIAILKRLPIENWDREWRPEWSQGKIYDNYFEYNGNKYILEMDGEFHYNAWRGENGMTLEETQQIDNLKNKLALEHNITIIRIDCQESTVTYIKNNILNSKLNEIFNLSNFDWEEVGAETAKNLLIEVCNYYNENKTKSLQEIGNAFHISNWTVKRYLERGTECGFCKYIPYYQREEVQEILPLINKRKPYTKKSSFEPKLLKKYENMLIYVYNEEKELIGTFPPSATECAKQLNILYPTLNFKSNKISERINGHGETHRNFYFIRKEVNKLDVDQSL